MGPGTGVPTGYVQTLQTPGAAAEGVLLSPGAAAGPDVAVNEIDLVTSTPLTGNVPDTGDAAYPVTFPTENAYT
ncbi:MAG: hypothetical protein ACREDE_06255, partial [Thermoplasmata archaeon]